MLTAIKALAVREENPKVARVALSRMVQDRGEPIRSFAARLRGQAEVCRFVKKCSGCEVVNNQGEQRVADQLCIGHNHHTHLGELTGRGEGQRRRPHQWLLTPTEAVDTLHTQSHPHCPQTTPTRTQPTPNRGQTNTNRPLTNNKATCCFCGRQGHGARPSGGRNALPSAPHAPRATGQTHMCWLKLAERESAISEDIHTMSEGTLPHQSWDSTSNRWIQRRSPPQPNTRTSECMDTP